MSDAFLRLPAWLSCLHAFSRVWGFIVFFCGWQPTVLLGPWGQHLGYLLLH